MYSLIGKLVLSDHLGSNTDPCCIPNRVITNRVIKRLRCIYNEGDGLVGVFLESEDTVLDIFQSIQCCLIL